MNPWLERRLVGLFWEKKTSAEAMASGGSWDGEAKFWLQPRIELGVHHGLSEKELKELNQIVEKKADEIREHWDKHFQWSTSQSVTIANRNFE